MSRRISPAWPGAHGLPNSPSARSTRALWADLPSGVMATHWNSPHPAVRHALINSVTPAEALDLLAAILCGQVTRGEVFDMAYNRLLLAHAEDPDDRVAFTALQELPHVVAELRGDTGDAFPF